VPNEIQENKIVPLWKLLKAKQDLELVRQQLEESDRAKKSALKRIGALEKEIEELTNQLKALETIDQKIQKKKSAIPSTD
jgi:septal ring factor EnvC (AmiA/AmiB activator)